MAQPALQREQRALALAPLDDGVKVSYAWHLSYAMAGDRARALDWLEKACAERDPNVMYLGINPVLDSLRAEPRFQALLRKMNLTQ